MEMKAELISPCGMNCRLCYVYNREKNPCHGCNGPQEFKPKHCQNCSIKHCRKRPEGGRCRDCGNPCRTFLNMDKQYREKYHMSMQENLTMLKEKGMDAFLADQEQKYRCPNCGEIVSVHLPKCLKCETIWAISSPAK